MMIKMMRRVSCILTLCLAACAASSEPEPGDEPTEGPDVATAAAALAPACHSTTPCDASIYNLTVSGWSPATDCGDIYCGFCIAGSEFPARYQTRERFRTRSGLVNGNVVTCVEWEFAGGRKLGCGGCSLD